jgi:protein involved in polysaccharide export with SLBB domain
LTLSQAIANAGGFHFAASRGQLLLHRRTASGGWSTGAFDHAAILAGTIPDVYLRNGDRVEIAANPIKVVPWALWGIVTIGYRIGGRVAAPENSPR